jgi:RNA polymerase sigma factor (sigma-70 family)
MSPLPGPDAGKQGSDERLAQDLAGAAGAARVAKHPHGAELSRLLRASRLGDAQARDALTQAHLDWVISAARERTDRGLSVADLFQEGTIGLLEAIDQFPSSDRADFEAFARERVTGRMDRALGDEERVVNESRMLVQAAEDYVRAEIGVRNELGRTASDAELAEKLKWSVSRTQEIGQVVADARRRHDEELLEYLEPEDIDLDTVIEDRPAGDAPAGNGR